MEAGIPYKLDAWDLENGNKKGEKGVPFYEEFVRPLLPYIWAEVKKHFPRDAFDMLASLQGFGGDRDGGFWGLVGPGGEKTGFSKVTVSLDNPTDLHWDKNNFGVTALLILPSEDLVGGTHALISDDFSSAVLVRDTPYGLLIIGDYGRVLHGNLATYAGSRFIVNMYCAKEVCKRLTCGPRAWQPAAEGYDECDIP